MKLLLAPHFDDEALFASFICLREHPLVAFCFDGAPRHGAFDVRWKEALAATQILGCEALTLRADYDTLAERLSTFAPEHVWAPLPEDEGNGDHNIVGEAAERLWPERVSFYSTYTVEGRTTVGYPVPAEPGWVDLKRRALACYQSQIRNPQTSPHFGRDLGEYEFAPTAMRMVG